ncbi:ABC transporter, permease domain protein, partial [Vibrio parahaemolyticus V-223/04]
QFGASVVEMRIPTMDSKIALSNAGGIGLQLVGC